VLLSIAACTAETFSNRPLALLYSQRDAESCGLAIGLLSLPWLAAGLAGALARSGHSAIYTVFSLHACLASSAATLMLVLFKTAGLHGPSPSATTPRRGGSPRKDSDHHPLSRIISADTSVPHMAHTATLSAPEGRAAQQLGRLCLAGGSAVVLASVGAAAWGGGSVAAGVAVATCSGAAVGLFEVGMRSVPRTFTVGEGIIVTQVGYDIHC
jgi:hypothetical protein